MRAGAFVTAVAIALFGLGQISPVRAADAGDLPLSAECSSWFGGGIALLICGDDDKTRGTARYPGSKSIQVDKDVGVAQYISDEPLMTGERASATVTRIGRGARFAVWVAANERGGHVVSVGLRAIGTSTITLDEELTVTVTDALGTRTFPDVPSLPLPQTPTDPEGVARAAVDALNRIHDGDGYSRLCSLLDGRGFDGEAGYWVWDVLMTQQERCRTPLYLATAGLENVPSGIATKAAFRGLVPIDERTMLMKVRLVHRYRPYSVDDKVRIAADARALLVKDALGAWHLQDPEVLLPLYATHSRWSLAELRQVHAELLRSTREGAKWSRRLRAATTKLDPAVGCPRTSSLHLTDKTGDVAYSAEQPARAKPEAVDLIAARLASAPDGSRCISVTFAETPPRTYWLAVEILGPKRAKGAAVIVVRDGVAELYKVRQDEGDWTYTPKAGGSAGQDATTLTVAVPPGTFSLLAPSRFSASARAPHPFSSEDFWDHIEAN